MSITRRSDLSLLYRILRTVIRPLRPHLVAPKRNKSPTGGSPRLKKHPRRLGEVTITEREVLVPSTARAFSRFPDAHSTTTTTTTAATTKTESVWVYDFHPPEVHDNAHGTTSDNSSHHPRTQTVYYFAGGGFQAPPSTEHWKFCAYIASALASSGDRVVLVSCPPAPARDALPLLRRWLARTLAAELDREVACLAGDSSGANIALSLALWCAEQAASAGAGASGTDAAAGFLQLRRLKAVLAISPPVDLRNGNGNPDSMARAADKQDPVLGKQVADRVAEAWAAGGSDGRRDPFVSPGLADLEKLRGAGVAVHGVVGTADVLAPDALAFMEKCKREYVGGDWLVWEGQMHCFPLAACYGLREGKEAREWVVKVLRGVS